jgi:hypothetical protein
MPPKKLVVIAIGLTMIGLLLYPPVMLCKFDWCMTYGHALISSEWLSPTFPYSPLSLDINRLVLYELALAGIGALALFVINK